jgi:hypothetical protein
VRRTDDVRRAVNISVVCLAVVAIAAASIHLARASRKTDRVPAITPSPQGDPRLNGAYRLVNVSDGSVAPFLAPEGGSWFRFSPGGSEVVFVKNDAHGRSQLFRMGADGSELTQITPDPEFALEAYEPAWSADGGWIAYSGVTRSGDRLIIATHPDGYHPPRAGLTGPGWGTGDARSPAWSPDGSKLADVANGIWIVPTEYYSGHESITSGPPRRILSAGTSPAWSPSGDQIVFISGRGSARRVAIANVDGTHVTEITDSTSDHPTWSPDGAMIAYDVWSRDGHVAVWLIDLRTGRHRLLLDDASVESWKDKGTLLVLTYPGGS